MLTFSLILLAAIVLYATEWIGVDLASVLVLAALILTGVLEPAEAFAGLSNPALLTVAFMFVLSAGLTRTGAVGFVGRWLSRGSGGDERKLILLMAASLCVISAFMNNTPIVVVFLPILLGVCARHDLFPSRLLIPLSYLTILGGCCTLIGTSTNLLVSGMLEGQGLRPMSMFELSAAGVPLALIGLAYILTAGRWLLPRRYTVSRTAGKEPVKDYLTEVRVGSRSPLDGKALAETPLWKEGRKLRVLQVVRGEDILVASGDLQLRPGDLLLVEGDVQTVLDLHRRLGAELDPGGDRVRGVEMVLAELVVKPNSRLIGHTPQEVHFRERFQVTPIAIQRGGRHIRTGISDRVLRFGDTILVQGESEAIRALRDSEALILVEGVDEVVVWKHRAPLAAAIMAGVVVAMCGGFASPLLATFIGAFLMITTRCLSMKQAYESLDMQTVLLIVGSLALGLGMEKTGTAAAAAKTVVDQVLPFGPMAVLASVYFMTNVLTSVLSNNAAAVLMVPLAVSAAKVAGCDPRPLVIAVCFAASLDFATPIGYQTNLFIYGPGGYRFSDYLKVGAPLNALLGIVAVILIPRFWPL